MKHVIKPVNSMVKLPLANDSLWKCIFFGEEMLSCNTVVIDKTFSKFRNVGAGRSPGGRGGKSMMGAKICLSEAGSGPSVMEGSPAGPLGEQCHFRVTVLISCWQIGHSASSGARPALVRESTLLACAQLLLPPPRVSFAHGLMEQARGWRGRDLHTSTGGTILTTWLSLWAALYPLNPCVETLTPVCLYLETGP